MKCEEVMIHDIPCCLSTDTVEMASKVMPKEIGTLLIRSSQHGHLVGIMTGGDIVSCVLASGRPPAEILVEAVMTRHTTTCYGDDDLATGLETMLRNHVERVSIINRVGKPLGILTLVDAILWSNEPSRVVDLIKSTAHRRETGRFVEPDSEGSVRPRVRHGGNAAS